MTDNNHTQHHTHGEHKPKGFFRKIKHSFKQKQIEGFTILELMVVIAIIGVLSSIVVVQTSTLRMRARDTRRIADLNTIKIALNQYYADNGTYPQTPYVLPTDPGAYYYSCDDTWPTFEAILSPYLKSVPKDPINTACPTGGIPTPFRSYVYTSQTKNDYFLYTFLEDVNNPYSCKSRPNSYRDWVYYQAILGGGSPVPCNPLGSFFDTMYVDH